MRLRAIFVFAATSSAMAGLTFLSTCRRDSRSCDFLPALVRVASMMNTRQTKLRIADFPHRPFQKNKVSLQQSVEIGHLLALARSKPNEASCQHAAGIAALMLGHSDDAITYLQRATKLAPDDEGVWSDLAVAFVESAADAPYRLIDALAAIEHAEYLNRTSQIILFNRTLILNHLNLHIAAVDARRRYVTMDPASPWRFELDSTLKDSSPPRIAAWLTQVPLLRRAALSGEIGAVHSITAQFPQLARTSSELLFLHEWANAEALGNESDAQRHLVITRAVGESLRARSGEALLSDAVDAIVGADERARRKLAKAHRLYYEARSMYRERRVSDALPTFERAVALFRKYDSPMALVAEYYVASCVYDLGRNRDALSRVNTLLKHVPHRYHALHAQLRWQRATILSASGLLDETLVEQSAAIAVFDRLGEHESATLVRSAASASYALLGRRADAWRMRLAILKQLRNDGNTEAVQGVIELAARTEALMGNWDTAYALFRVASDRALRRNPRLTSSALFWRALAAHRLRRHADAERLMQSAAASVASIPDAGIARRATADVTFGRGLLSRDPARALDLLTIYIREAATRSDLFLVPEAYIGRARAQVALRLYEGAIADYETALKYVDQRRKSGDRHDLRDAYFQTSDAALREAVALLDRLGDIRRIRFLLDARRVTERMPSGGHGGAALFVRYFVLPDRLLVLIDDDRGASYVRVSVDRGKLIGMKTRLVDQIVAGNDSDALNLASQLAKWLIAPVRPALLRATRMFILPDDLLLGMPFAALPFDHERRLIEQAEIVIVPGTWPRNRAASTSLHRRRPVVTIANPSFDRSLFPALADLPAAERSAAEIAQIYGSQTTIITRQKATRENVTRSLGTAAIADISSHAMIVADDPRKSYFVLTPADAGDTGLLRLREIENLRLPQLEVIVLAGCHTSAPVSEQASATSLARAFLDAGAANAVGTLWEIEDDAAGRFSIEFHRRLSAGESPAGALRSAQRVLAAVKGGGLRQWSGFSVYGSGD